MPTEAEARRHAVALLLSFGSVRSPSHVEGVLQPRDVGSGGWCFFNAFYDQLGSALVPSPKYLAVLALSAVAAAPGEFESSVPGSGYLGNEEREVREAREALAAVAAYCQLGVVQLLTPFECVVLDKFEGVLTGDLLDSRRYADDADMQALLRPVGLEVLVLESNDALADTPARSRLYPSWEPVGDSVRQRLGAGDVDMIFVRYELGSYLHYESVAFVDGRPWAVCAAKRSAVEALFSSCDVCDAVRAGEYDLARTLMLTRLRDAAASVRGVGVL